MPRTGFLLASACLLLALVGCQSGKVGLAFLSADGRVIAYQDEEYGEVYVHNGQRRYCYGRADAFVLSPDGRWLVRFRRQRPSDDAFQPGDELVAFEIGGKARIETTLPYRADKWRPARVTSAAEGPMLIDKEHNVPPLRSAADATVAASSGDGACDARAIILGDGPYWAYDLAPTPSKEWRPWTPPKANWPPHAQLGPHPELVKIPPSATAPLGTLWVRDDGEVFELLRRNDGPIVIPGRIANALGLSTLSLAMLPVGWTLALFTPEAGENVLARLLNTSEFCVFAALIPWRNTLEEFWPSPEETRDSD